MPGNFLMSQSRGEIAERLDGMRNKFEKAQEELNKFTRKIDSESGSLATNKVTLMQEFGRQNEGIKELIKRLQVQRAYSDEIQKKLDSSLETNNDLRYQWDEATNESLSNKNKVKLLTFQLEGIEEELDIAERFLLNLL